MSLEPTQAELQALATAVGWADAAALPWLWYERHSVDAIPGYWWLKSGDRGGCWDGISLGLTSHDPRVAFDAAQASTKAAFAKQGAVRWAETYGPAAAAALAKLP